MTSIRTLLTASVLFAFAPLAMGGDDTARDILLVVGAPGSPEYEEEFGLWLKRWTDYAEQSKSQLEIIGDVAEADSNDRDLFQDAIGRRDSDTEAPFIIVLVGHGTHLRGTSKFNLRGPDVTDKQLAEWLEPLNRPLVVVQCASSSAPFLRALSGEDRIIITATRSQTQQNFSRFGDQFASALSDPRADLDHDDAISLLEAFLLASYNVAEFYRHESRLATEHSLLDDNADQLGSSAAFFRGIRATKTAKGGATLDGMRAHQIVLFQLPGHVPLDPSLLGERDEVEQEIEALRQRKTQMTEDEYFTELEPLMVKLARLYHRSPDE